MVRWCQCEHVHVEKCKCIHLLLTHLDEMRCKKKTMEIKEMSDARKKMMSL